jgi:hypothetical protein
MRERFALLAGALVLAGVVVGARAQTIPPVQPQLGLHGLTLIEVRLKGAPTATNPSPTVRLIKWKPATIDAKTFTWTEPCWNAKSSCPQVVAATVRVYLSLPWLPNVNVTRFVLCGGSECLLPAFAPMQAKPGEGYRLSYDRYTAQWVEAPKVISSTAP